MTITPDKFIELLNGGKETPSVEFKPSGPRTDALLFAFVARAVLAMTNRPLGGWIVLGVDSDANLIGLNDNDRDTWLQFDEVSDGLNAYADPFVQIAVEFVNYKNKQFVVIHVREFEEVPVLARKDSPSKHDGKLVIRRGGCYVRPRHKPASIEVPTQTEMRELIDAAVDKQLKRVHARAALFGLTQGGTPPLSDEVEYDNELKGFR
jgi:predicted HTH transcriptional regulator